MPVDAVPPPSLWLTVVLGGELDVSTAPDLDACVAALAGIDDAGLVLDLRDVTFMDCSTLGSIVAARKRFGDRLVLGRPSPCVLRLLTLTGLITQLQVAWVAAATTGRSAAGTPARRRPARGQTFTQGYVLHELAEAQDQRRTGMDAEDLPDPDRVFERRLACVLDGQSRLLDPGAPRPEA